MTKREEFLQGFAIGFCLCIDMFRERGMAALPDTFSQGAVMFADSVEADMKLMPDIGEILKTYSTPESRAAMLKNFMQSVRS